jgi:hypothetical protein
MRKGLICLAGAGVLALAAAAPTATLAKSDWGVSVSPGGGIYVGPQREYRYRDRYDRYSYRNWRDDEDYWRYRDNRRYYD